MSVIDNCERSTSKSIRVKKSVHTHEVSTRKWKIRTRKVDCWRHAYAYACSTDVHTDETKEISISISISTKEIKGKCFFFLCLFLCLNSKMAKSFRLSKYFFRNIISGITTTIAPLCFHFYRVNFMHFPDLVSFISS